LRFSLNNERPDAVTPDCYLPLELLRSGEWGEVAEVTGDPCWVGRMAELGLRAGIRLQVVCQGCPCLLLIDGCRLCVRSDLDTQIYVRPLPAAV
jgi:hypothetical protein